jgi:putative Mn2+ efflux pump MntP
MPKPISAAVFMLITLAVANSYRCSGIGLSFAFLKTNIVAASLIIGIVAFAITILGFI